MSHELTIRKNGQVEFAYLASDRTPWHGLGQPMADNAGIDDWRNAAGMDWSILRSKVRYATERGDAGLIELPEHHVLFRSDSKAALGVVSNKYQVVQPAEMLEFFRDIAKVGGLELSAAGTIYGGKRFWATAKIGEASPTSLADSINGYILISSSADGSLATEVRRTTVRVVCKNTLQMAMADAAASVKVSHRSVFDSANVKTFMGLNEAAWDAFKHNLIKLANVPMHEEHAAEIVAGLFATGDSQEALDKARETAGYRKVLALFNGEGMGAELDGVFGTANGVLQAITEYTDHHIRARSDENRFVSAHWGTSAQLKQRAFDQLMALAA